MRKTYLSTLFLVASFFLSAQTSDKDETTEKTITFGIRTGYEFQVNESDLNYKLNLPYVGFTTNFKLHNKWSLQLELNARYENIERRFNNVALEDLNEIYFTVPVLLKYNINNKLKTYIGSQVLSSSLTAKNNNRFVKWNGILGAEYYFKENLYFEARYRQSFETQTQSNNFIDNRLSLGIGFKF